MSSLKQSCRNYSVCLATFKSIVLNLSVTASVKMPTRSVKSLNIPLTAWEIGNVLKKCEHSQVTSGKTKSLAVAVAK